MRASEQDWSQRLEEARRDQVLRDAVGLRKVAQGDVLASRLTGSEEWDAFLRVLQGMRDEAERRFDGLRDQLASGEFQGSEVLVRMKILAERAKAHVEALDEVSQIPKVLTEQGEKARELLAKYAEDGTN